jgi:hypothetical protein
MGRYFLADEFGEYSANAGDYWHRADSDRFDGMVLVKRSHAYRTVTGRTVHAERVLRSDPTMRDLRRLAAAS